MAVFNVWRKDTKKLNNLKIFEIIIRVHNTLLAQVIGCENLLFGPLGEAIAAFELSSNFQKYSKNQSENHVRNEIKAVQCVKNKKH